MRSTADNASLKDREKAQKLRDEILPEEKENPAVAAAGSIVNKPVQMGLFDNE